MQNNFINVLFDFIDGKKSKTEKKLYIFNPKIAYVKSSLGLKFSAYHVPSLEVQNLLK